MTANEYLKKILESQTLADDSRELKALRAKRDEVEGHLRDAFGSSPTIRYGGSQAKGTLVKDSYDLDVVCYFPREDDGAGETLEGIYNSVKDVLSKHYYVEPKGSALRVKGLDKVDFHVDVVPGRFIEEDSYDVFLYRSSGEKCRLKTNIETHIAHVRDSDVTEAIRLMKVWRTRHGLQLKTFILELIVIDTLAGSTAALDKQIRSVLERLRDDADGIAVEDPANGGNDLFDAWNASVRSAASAIARSTLAMVDSAGWEAVFGKLPETDPAAVSDSLHRIARASVAPSKPWCADET
jgi:hypothetical protein